MKKGVAIFTVIQVLASAVCLAKASSITLQWPQDKPAIKLTFGKFQQIAVLAGQSTFVCDVVVENLSDKPVPRASTAENLWNKKISGLGFNLYLYDKNKVRIGDGWITIENVPPGQSVKFQTTVHALGTPVSVELAVNSVPAELQPLAPPKKISMTVNSVPQGAVLSVDGVEAGTTPKLVQLTVGKHSLGFV